MNRIGDITLQDGSIRGYLKYDKEDNEVIMTVTAEQLIESLQSVDKELANEGIRIVLSNANNTRLLNLMADAKAGFVFLGIDGSQTIEIARLTPTEMEQVRQHPISESRRKDLLLENYIAKTSSALPNDVADGVVYWQIELVGDDVVQRYLIDDELFDIKELEQMLLEHKYDIEMDALSRNEYDIYTSHDKGLKMEYHTESPTPVLAFVITYSVDELKKLLQN